MATSSTCFEIVHNVDSTGDWYYVIDAKSHPMGYDADENRMANPYYATGTVGPLARYSAEEFKRRITAIKASLCPKGILDDPEALQAFSQAEYIALGAYAISGRFDNMADGEIVTANGNMQGAHGLNDEEIAYAVDQPWTFRPSVTQYELAA